MKILLPFDGSPPALAAVHCVLRMAQEGMACSVVLANVQEPASLYELMVMHDPQAIDELAAAAGANTLLPAQALLDAAGISYECEVASGDPAHTLVDIQENFGCGMVVMGASGNTRLRSALLGSVSNEVLHACSAPVLIVKDGDEAAGPDEEPA